MGTFIALEGIDGSGKSTLGARLAQSIREAGCEVVLTREPGGTAIGEQIRGIVLENAALGMTPATEALLFAAARAQLVAEVIRPALQRRAVVVIDRFVDSSLAYQWGGRGLERRTIETIQHLATGGLSPNLKLLFDLPVEQALSRRHADAASTNRMDRETVQFHEQVRAAYLELVEEDGLRWRVIDARPAPNIVWRDVVDAVNDAGVLPRKIA